MQDTNQFVPQILSNFPEGIVVYGPDLKVQVWNPFMERLTGLAAADVLGKHPLEVLPFLRDVGIGDALQRALTDGITTATDVPFTHHQTGQQEWAVDTSSPLRDSQGRIIGVLGIVRNDTKNKKAVADLIQQHNLSEASQWKQRYELIAAASGLIVYDYNCLNNTIEWGGSIEQVLGYTLEEMNGGLEQWENLIDPCDRPEALRLLKIAKRDSTPYTAEYAYRHKKGHYIQIRDHALFLSDASGKTTRLIGAMQDITQQKQAQESLRESRQILQTMVDSSPVAISWANADGNIEHDNRKFYDLFGYHPEEIPTVDSWFEHAWPDPTHREEIHARWNAAIAAASAEGTDIAPIETRITAKNGRVLDIIMSGAIAANRVLTTFTDITERKQAIEALKISEQLFRSIFEESATGVAMSDPQGRFLQVNPAFCAMLGYTTNELLSKSFADITHPDDQINERLMIQSLMSGQKSSCQVQKRYVCKDGHIVWGLLTISIIRDAQGRPQYFIGQVQDITERKQTAEAIERAKKDWERTFDAVPDLIAIIDRNHRITRANKAMADRLRLTPSQCVGKLCYEIVHCENSPPEACPHAQLLKDMKEHTTEVYLPNMGGHFVVSTSPLLGSDGELIGCVHVSRDITDRKKLEDQFRQSQKMQAFGQLAGGVAHDFNNILTVIMAHASLLKRPTRTKEQQQESVGEISQAAERAAMLTRQLLTFSRRQTMQPKNIDLNEIVTGMSKMLYRLIGEHISLQTRLASVGAPILADPGMMEQVIMNMAINSRDAMPHGGQFLLETTSVIIDRSTAHTNLKAKIGQYVRLSITDTGCGISPELIPHIFEPFFTTKEAGKGTGLGLATVFGIVEQHNGWITVDSQIGRGTTFHIYLPQRIGGAIDARKEPAMADSRGGSETILLVEDEPAVRRLLRSILERYGYQILEAESGVAALSIWHEKRQAIDLLLTDIVMPQGISGWELADRLLTENPKLKVIYSSGYNPEMSGEDSPRRRGCRFLRKPFELSVVLKTIRDTLDAK